MTEKFSPSAPLALFVFRRPDHVRRVVESLKQNAEISETDLFIFSDGARNSEDLGGVNQVRRFCRQISGFRSLVITEQEQNLGLATSIINGVSSVLKSSDRVIVLEDDIHCSEHFLKYMNDGLNLYAHAEQVASIHAYRYPVSVKLPETFFIRGADCWGWGTWRRAWKLFNPEGQQLLEQLHAANLCEEFDFGGAFPFTQMLEDQIAGRNDSWAIRWYASTFLANHLTLYPGTSLVHNFGNDSSGTHCGTTTSMDVQIADTPIDVQGVALEEDIFARKAFGDFCRQVNPPRLSQSGKVLRFFSRLMERIAAAISRSERRG